MILDFKTISQTSRTLIIERFNDQAPNLCTVLKGLEPGEMLDKVDDKLCVKSFEEFKEKFQPTAYEIFSMDENGEPMVTYSLEKRDGANEIHLCEHEFYKAVHDVAEDKSANAKNNNQISYDKLYEALDPELIYKRARRRRDEVKQFISNAIDENKNGNPDGARRFMALAKKVFNDVKMEYSGSALRLLPIAVRDMEILLETKTGGNSNLAGIGDGSMGSVPAIPCKPEWDSEGNLVAIPLDETNPTPALAIEASKKEVLALSAKGWETTADSIPAGKINRDLFLSVYSEQHNSALAELPIDELIERKQYLGNCYLAAQQSFCNAVGYLVQKVASLEQFFLHAGGANGKVESGVIIANCSADDIIENKQLVSDYLKFASNQDKDRIWLAVLPAMMNTDKSDPWEDSISGGDFDLFTFEFDLPDSEETSSSQKMDGTVTAARINLITECFADYGILSFVNFNACEKTGFKNFGADSSILEEYDKELKGLKRPDATVLAYPNFTIIPRNKSQLKEIVNGVNLYVPSIYVDAAYVAAGIVAATQNEMIQKKKFGKKVIDGRPFIRFDLEEDQNCRAFMAKFNPESRLNMDNLVATRLKGRQGNAFCFRSDTNQNNAFVYTSRTLNARPVYYFLTKNYFTFLLDRAYSFGRTTVNDVKSFINAVNNIATNETNPEIVNRILQTGDAFMFDDQKQKPILRFKGIEEPVDINIDIQED